MSDTSEISKDSGPTAASRLAAIVESSNDAIVSKDLEGIVTSWNRGARDILGYTAEEMIGQPILRLIPVELQDEETRILSAIRQGERVPHFETRRLTKDGRMVEVSIAVSPIRDERGIVVGASKVMRDISATKRQERELIRISRLYDALSQINQSIIRFPNRDELFREACRHLVDRGGFHMAWIGWNDPVTHRLLPIASAGDDTHYLDAVEIYADDRPQGSGPSGLALRSGQPYVSNDMLNDEVLLPWRAEFMERGFRTSAAIPIREAGRVGGVLTVYARQVGYFGDKEIKLLSEAASDISFALDNLARENERRRAAAAVESEKLFADAMIDSMPGILYFYDDTGRFLRWNKNFESISGYSAAEIASMQPLDFFAEPEKQRVQEKISEVFTAGKSFVEAGLLCKDGRTVPHFLTGRKLLFQGRVCLVGVGIDVSERQQAELERERSEARYRTLFEHAPDGILIFDEALLCVDANESFCSMMGRSRRELANMPVGELVAPWEHEALGLKLNSQVARREWDLRRKDGSFFSADVLARKIPNAQIMAIVRDITARKAAEAALRDVNQTLERSVAERTADLKEALTRAEKADQMKSAFLATMSHELRTPLNSIIGFTGIMLQGLAGSLTPEQNKQLGMVRGSARHLLELINDVLDISKIEAGQLEVRFASFSLPALLERAVASVRPLAEKKGLAIECTISPELGEMTSDRRRLEQIVINLLGNAVKFTEHGGISLRADFIPDYKFGRAGVTCPAVALRVSDTGIGIKPEDLATLFQPFHQIDNGLARSHEGTGLGLAICKRLAILMGGEIAAESQWQKGSTFILTIPLFGSAAS